MKRLLYVWLCVAIAVFGIAMIETSQPVIVSPGTGFAMAHADSDTVQIHVEEIPWEGFDLFWWLRKEPW